jgi:hypothetical protein
MKVWAHDLDIMVLMLEDLRKKQLVGLVYSINQISDELTPTSIEKCFIISTMEEKTAHDIIVHWNEFVELFKIKKD